MNLLKQWKMFNSIVGLLVIVFIPGCVNSNLKDEKRNCDSVESCGNQIMLRVQSKAKWICDQKSNDKQVTVKSILSKSGEIKEITLVASSGDGEFDSAALIAVRKSAPFTEMNNLSEKDFEMASVINFIFTGNESTD